MNTNKFYMFVAEWCPHCRAAKPAIFELLDKYHSKGNIFLIEDSSDEYQTIGRKLNADALPHFVIANENDEEVKVFEGERSFKNLEYFYTLMTETEKVQEETAQ